MILPGISGSFILLLLGLYSVVLGAVKDLDMLVLAVFASGCLVGILSFARLLSWLLSRWRDMSLAFLTGLMLGSLNKVWPWKETLSWRIDSKGEQVPLLQNNLLPGHFADVSGQDPQTMLEGKTIADHLLEPTRIYVKNLLALIKSMPVHALCHITGGGFWENIPRVLPENTKAVIDGNSWQWPAIFNWLQQQGNISRHEMYRTFNCGVGMIVVVPQDKLQTALSLLSAAGETAWHLGEIHAAAAGDELVIINE